MSNNSRSLLFTRVAVLAGLLNLLSAGWTLAQTSPESEPESKEPTTTATQTDERPPARSGNSDGGFTPSEEISEDLSVSFPVDI